MSIVLIGVYWSEINRPLNRRLRKSDNDRISAFALRLWLLIGISLCFDVPSFRAALRSESIGRTLEKSFCFLVVLITKQNDFKVVNMNKNSRKPDACDMLAEALKQMDSLLAGKWFHWFIWLWVWGSRISEDSHLENFPSRTRCWLIIVLDSNER